MMTCGSCGYVGENLEFMPTTEGDYWCPRCEFGSGPEDGPEDEDDGSQRRKPN